MYLLYTHTYTLFTFRLNKEGKDIVPSVTFYVLKLSKLSPVQYTKYIYRKCQTIFQMLQYNLGTF